VSCVLEFKFLQLVFCSVADFVRTRLFFVVQLFDLSGCVWMLVICGCVLELLNQKSRGFLVSFALKRLFPEHAHELFGEIPVRI
jgi:hypothetical protein